MPKLRMLVTVSYLVNLDDSDVEALRPTRRMESSIEEKVEYHVTKGNLLLGEVRRSDGSPRDVALDRIEGQLDGANLLTYSAKIVGTFQE